MVFVKVGLIMITGKNKLGGLWAQPDCTVQYDMHCSMIRWCIDQYGAEGPGNPNDHWMEYGGKFYFRDESACTMFILRWA